MARTMAKKIEFMEIPVTILDLAKAPNIDSTLSRFFDEDTRVCLYIGSPVYAAHPVPPVMALIDRLPMVSNGFSVPFVTWGAVTSGIALYEMGSALTDRGYPVLGAAKVTAQHSMMWTEDTPLGAQRPNDEDEQVIEDLVEYVSRKLQSQSPTDISLSDLDYQDRVLRQQMLHRSFEAAKAGFPPKKINQNRCTACGICVDNCPVDAINLVDALTINDLCIHCFNCVRLCPESAITADLEPIHDFIRQRSARIKESLKTKIFL